MGGSGEGPSDLIRSVSRALRVLEEVGATPQGLTAKQVARRCEINLSTAYHLLRTLSYEGYLIRRSHGVYRIGYEIANRFRDLAHSLQQPPGLRPVLQHLASVTGYSCYLSRIVDERVVIAEVVEAPGSPHLEDLVTGFSESAHATALGKALLAAMPQPKRHFYLRSQGMHALTPRTVVEPERLDLELQSQSRAGFFFEESQFRDGVSCAAVLVRGRGLGTTWASLALSMSSSRFRRLKHDMVGELRLAAEDLASIAV